MSCSTPTASFCGRNAQAVAGRRRSRPPAGRPPRAPPAAAQLELEAQQDVQVVGDLVGLDADQRRLHPVGLAVEVLGGAPRPSPPGTSRASPARSGARTAGCGRPRSPTAATATRAGPSRAPRPAACPRRRDRSPARRGRGRPRAGVEKMAVEGVALVDPRGQPDVVQRDGRGERMGRAVLPAGVEVEAEVGEQPHREVPLVGVGEDPALRTAAPAAAARRRCARSAPSARHAGRPAAAPACVTRMPGS